jgi:3-oxoacyl-[acyl-carrier-protein] synthase-3
LRILGTGSALPALSVENAELAKFLDTSDEWITTRTGIKSSHILSKETLTDIAILAAKRALEDANTDGSELDLILGTTTRGEQIAPGVAATVQKAIGASCPCMDLNAACAGFLYGLETASAFISSGKAKKVLIVSAEAMSRQCDWRDRATSVLFGDGAGAVVLDGQDGLKSIRLTVTEDVNTLFIQPTPGNCPFSEPSPVQPGVHMAGQEVFKFAVSHATEDISKVVSEANTDYSSVRWFLLHQANRRILESVRQRLNQPEEKFPGNISHVGNTSSASIPILMDELNKEGRLAENDIMVLSAFGAGLTTGACVLVWHKRGHND